MKSMQSSTNLGTLILIITILNGILILSAFGQMNCRTKDARVLVLGAGMSGISAVSILNIYDINDFIILEARGEIGGRMQSTELLPGLKVELGANWIQGIDINQPDSHPLYKIASMCGGIEGVISNFSSSIVYDVIGKDITHQLRNNDYIRADTFAGQLSINMQKRHEKDITFQKALEMGNWTVHSQNDRYVEWMKFDLPVGQSADKTSLFMDQNDATYEVFGKDPLNYFITDQKGFASVAKCLASQFLVMDDKRLHLNSVVNAINWSDDCVCVTALEAGVNKTYCADYAIVTFSIGVLQSDEGQRMFSPSLPGWKMDAINTMQLSHYFKIFIAFDEPFWTDKEFFGYVTKDVVYSIPFYQSINRYFPSKPNVLLATAVSDEALRLSKLSDATLLNEIMADLRNIYGSNVSKPIKILHNSFSTNPLFNGAYSYTPFGVTLQTFKDIAAPVGHLYFTGEATSADFYGYVHGAYYAGLDTGDVVAQNVLLTLYGINNNNINNIDE